MVKQVWGKMTIKLNMLKKDDNLKKINQNVQ